jgi:hypothetical protein
VIWWHPIAEVVEAGEPLTATTPAVELGEFASPGYFSRRRDRKGGHEAIARCLAAIHDDNLSSSEHERIAWNLSDLQHRHGQPEEAWLKAAISRHEARRADMRAFRDEVEAEFPE